MAMERITDLQEPPVVGKYYLVPCVQMIDHYGHDVFAPVIGNLHHDDFAAGVGWHYHYDHRFRMPGTIEWHTYTRQKTNGCRPGIGRRSDDILGYLDLKIWKGKLIDKDNPPEIHWRRKKCVSQFGGLCVPRNITLGEYVDWAKKYEKTNIKKTMKCPHHGVCLKSVPVHNGVIECPLHGLKWDAESGDNIPIKQFE